ncbi:MAG TPA: chorismate mutase [Caulobacteraceae bacterium]|nr:chorismate mutase [Caulobacteraceae bacterium]
MPSDLDRELADLLRRRVQAAEPDDPGALRRLLGEVADPALVLRVRREAEAAARPIQALNLWGGRNPLRTLDLARARFGAAAPLRAFAKAEEALAAARSPGAVSVLALEPGALWWGRMLAEPALQAFAALPETGPSAAPLALAVAAVETEPSGSDDTFWVTDAPEPAARIAEALGREGLAAEPLLAGGGLKLFALAGYVQRQDERLSRAPGRLAGVIGSAPTPFDFRDSR